MSIRLLLTGLLVLSVGSGCGDAGFGTASADSGGDETGANFPGDETGDDIGDDLPDDPLGGVGDVFVGEAEDAGTHEDDQADDARGGDDAEDDAGPSEDAEEPTTTELKDDDTYLVPPGVVRRAGVTVADGRAAWVETATFGDPTLVLWDFASLAAPEPLTIPYLTAPRELVLTDSWLVYVDERYGDADVFAVRLSDRANVTVAAVPGDQDQPAARGDLAAWRDCRDCLAGGTGAEAEIYLRDLAGEAPGAPLTDDDTADHDPAFGTLADGGVGLAWVSGDTRLRAASVADQAVDASWDVGQSVYAVALTDGVIAWREWASIINPDSMMPIDIYGTTVVDGDTKELSTHAELAPGLAAAPVAEAGRVAWLESVPGELPMGRISLTTPDGEPFLVVEELGADAPTLSGEALGFVAPRNDNGGMPDVWILPLDP